MNSREWGLNFGIKLSEKKGLINETKYYENVYFILC